MKKYKALCSKKLEKCNGFGDWKCRYNLKIEKKIQPMDWYILYFLKRKSAKNVLFFLNYKLLELKSICMKKAWRFMWRLHIKVPFIFQICIICKTSCHNMNPQNLSGWILSP